MPDEKPPVPKPPAPPAPPATIIPPTPPKPPEVGAQTGSSAPVPARPPGLQGRTKETDEISKVPAPPPRPFELRLPQNAALRSAVDARLEDVADTVLMVAGGTAPSWLDSLLAAFGPMIAALIAQRFLPQPTPQPVSPTVHQDLPTVPPPVVVVTPPVVPGIAKIVGGKGKITGMMKGGPLGTRLGRNVIDALLGGEKLGDEILDLRIEFDGTPNDGVSDFGHDDPRWVGQPNCPRRPEYGDTDGPMQPMRLRFTYRGAGSCDLAHEYANKGCTPRLRIKVPQGQGGELTDIFFEGPDYGDGRSPVRIEVAEGPIYIGAGV